MPAHYGDPEGERAAMEDGCAVFDASVTPCLEMRGDDRRRFLNGLVTADVGNLAAGESRYGLFPTVKGRILADVTVLAHEESFWLRLPPSTDETITAHVEKHVITDRVEIGPLDDRCRFLVLGAAAEQLSGWFDGWLDDGELPADGAHRRARLDGAEVIVSSEPRWSRPAYSLWVSTDRAAGLVERMVAGEGVEPVGFEALERLRVELGIPRFGADFGLDTFPQEAGLDAAVSYEKGCYLGQEVIARIHYRGGVQRRLMVLEGGGEELPEIGESVSSSEESGGLEEVGKLTSRARRYGAPGWRALAMVKVRAADPGTRLDLASGVECRVVEPAGATTGC